MLLQLLPRLPVRLGRPPRADAADRNISAPSKELRAARQSVLGALVFNRLWELRHTTTRRIFQSLRAARESGLGALVFNRLWELRHTTTRRIFNHPGTHHPFPLGRHPFESL